MANENFCTLGNTTTFIERTNIYKNVESTQNYRAEEVDGYAYFKGFERVSRNFVVFFLVVLCDSEQ